MACILLVGAERRRAADLRRLLVEDRHDVELVASPSKWVEAERAVAPEVIVASVDAPEAMLRETASGGRGFPAPLLFVHHASETTGELFLDDRLVDLLELPVSREALLARVDALVRVRRILRSGSIERGAAEPSPRLRPGRFARRIVATLRSRRTQEEKPLEPYLEVAGRLAEWADRRDAFDPGHAERVTSLCAMIAEALALDDATTGTLLRAAMLHDIGKVVVPVEVLHQRAPLAEHQMRMIRTHPRRGAALLRELDRDRGVSEAVLYHHERPDGAGYYGLPSSELPIESRALAVAEVFDAMTSSRFGPRASASDAVDRLRGLRGSNLDADCVDALVDRIGPRRPIVPLSVV